VNVTVVPLNVEPGVGVCIVAKPLVPFHAV
jgi:hypothetical protein